MTEMKRETLYSHFGSDGRMRRSALIDFMQDCCTVSRREDKAIGPMMISGEALLYVAYRQLDILSQPRYREVLTVTTQLFESRRIYGRRITRITGDDGRLCAASYQVSTLVSAKTRRPLKLSEEVNSRIELAPAPDMELTPRRIDIPETGGELRPAFTAMRCQADTNGHINNARYADLGDELVDPAADPFRLRCEYRASFMPGDKILPTVYHREGSDIITFSNEAGEICSVLEYIYR
ncbi:MAG: hypothetical protein IKP47_07655 [Ruminococcus sp.]|nr:hypothetical protein [Ruminococcus sp.]